MKLNHFHALSVFRRVIALCLGIAYYLAILSCYYYVISPMYSYRGMHFTILPVWAWMVSVTLALIPLLWLPLDFNRPSDFAAWFLYLLLIFPSNIVIYMVTSLPLSETVILPIALTASFSLFEFIRQKGLFTIHHIKGPKILFNVALPIFMVIMSIIALSYANFKINISFADVYERRLDAREILSGSTIINYSLAFLRSVCMPIAVVYAMQQKKWYFTGLAALVVIAIFSLDGSKGAVFLPLVLVIVVSLSARSRKNLGFWLLGGLVLLILFALVERSLLGTTTIATMIVRRELIVTNQLTTYYWEFFSNNPFVFMKDSWIGWLIPAESNYLIPRARLIGFEYLGNIETNANANIWAAGFADFGYVGMVMTSILAALVLKVIDSIGSRDKFLFASICSSVIGFAWINSALYTSMLTSGGLGLILAVWLYPAEIDSHVKGSEPLQNYPQQSLVPKQGIYPRAR